MGMIEMPQSEGQLNPNFEQIIGDDSVRRDRRLWSSLVVVFQYERNV